MMTVTVGDDDDATLRIMIDGATKNGTYRNREPTLLNMTKSKIKIKLVL